VAFNIRVRVDFIVVTTLVSLVAKEVNLGEALALDMAQAVGLVPSSGKHIERDLSTNGKGQVKVRESSLQVLNKLLAESTFLRHRQKHCPVNIHIALYKPM
jgi:hypothetical protein